MIEICNLRYSKPHKPYEFLIGRPSPVGNPFVMKNESERDRVCEIYDEYFQKKLETSCPFTDYLEQMAKAL